MDFAVGQDVTVERGFTGQDAVGWHRSVTVPAGTVVNVRRVSTHKVMVRMGGNVLWASKEFFAPVDPNAPRPRKLGETPEGDHIAIDDPRIDWIWRDAAKYATNRGYCGYYDSIASELGIPGRERNFKVKATVSGLTGTFSVKARSKAEAERLFAAKVDAASISAEES